MKIIAPSLRLICNRQIDRIENNYMNWFNISGEKNLQYLFYWNQYKNYLNDDVTTISKNVKYITDPFFKLVNKQFDILAETYVNEGIDNNKEFLNFKGILFSNEVGCILELKGSVTCYTLFDKFTGVPFITSQFEFDENIGHFEPVTRYYLSKCEKAFNGVTIISDVVYFILAIIMEKMIDRKELIIVPPNGKIKTKHEKYVNENPTGIEVWDSRMFNSYVRLEGFSVTGHFRRQRVGEGRINQKLIWINAFEKHGYNCKEFRNNPN